MKRSSGAAPPARGGRGDEECGLIQVSTASSGSALSRGLTRGIPPFGYHVYPLDRLLCPLRTAVLLLWDDRRGRRGDREINAIDGKLPGYNRELSEAADPYDPSLRTPPDPGVRQFTAWSRLCILGATPLEIGEHHASRDVTMIGGLFAVLRD